MMSSHEGTRSSGCRSKLSILLMSLICSAKSDASSPSACTGAVTLLVVSGRVSDVVLDGVCFERFPVAGLDR